jgi:hypothetical protein
VFVLYIRLSIILVFLSIYVIYTWNFVYSMYWFNVQHQFTFNFHVFSLCMFVCLNQILTRAGAKSSLEWQKRLIYRVICYKLLLKMVETEAIQKIKSSRVDWGSKSCKKSKMPTNSCLLRTDDDIRNYFCW